jgi:hypothetical protein
LRWNRRAEVVDFLQRAKLGAYAEAIVDAGYDHMPFLLE